MTSEKLRPLEDRIVVREVKAEERTVGGLVIPELAKKGPRRGVVVEVGPGRRESGGVVPPAVRVGDVVLMDEFVGTEVELNGETLRVLDARQVLAVVETVEA